MEQLYFNMALRTVEDWTDWLSGIISDKEVSTLYATELVDSAITEEDLSELNHELLIEMKITKPGHRTKILKKAKTTNVQGIPQVQSASTKMIKLPHITKNCSPSQFRKFLIDWDIYKSENQIAGLKCNKLLYSVKCI